VEDYAIFYYFQLYLDWNHFLSYLAVYSIYTHFDFEPCFSMHGGRFRCTSKYAFIVKVTKIALLLLSIDL